MKVLHVLDHSLPLHSGYSFRSLSILREQAGLQWVTVQLTSDRQGSPGEAVEIVEGLAFHRTRAGSGLAGRMPVLRELASIYRLRRRIASVLAAERPDIIHAHSPALNGAAAWLAARRSGARVVYECRAFWEDAAVDHGTAREWGLRYRLTRLLETLVFRFVDGVVCICAGLRAEVVGRGIGADKVSVVPNGVQSAVVRAGRSLVDRKMRSSPRAKIVLGFVGSFYQYEGLDLALLALRALLDKGQQIEMVFAGGGPQEAELRRLTRTLALDDAVHFLGRVDHSKIDEVYAGIDVAVFPRRSMRLTELVTPLKPLEAMCKGCVVVASDVGGHRELISHGVTGLLFPPGDAGALSETLEHLMTIRADWSQILATAYAFVESERDWSKLVQRYRKVYDHAGCAVAAEPAGQA